MNTWFLYSILMISGSPLTSAEWNTKKREYVKTNRILQTIEELSIVSCHSRCKINPECVSYATEGDVSMGELDTCYLLADHASSNPLGSDPDDMIEMYIMDIVPIKVIKSPSPSTTSTNNTNMLDYKVLNDKEYEANGYVYHFANKKKGSDAIKFCKNNNHGHVTSLMSANEEDILQYIRDKHHPGATGCFWIGMKKDENADKKFGTWLDGSPVSYKRWKDGKIGINKKNCVMMCVAGWTTDNCSEKGWRYFFCKKKL